MSKKFDTKKAILLGLAAGVAYKAIKGEGIFNKPRFYRQHEAAKKYLSSKYPDAKTGDIIKTEDGWSCIVYLHDKNFVLYITQSNTNEFIFSEKTL